MLISDQPKLLFVHIPKTAGTSLTRALAPEASRSHRLCLSHTQHETAEDCIARIGRVEFDAYHSFAVVRHPLDRFISHFSYLKNNPNQFPEMNQVRTMEEYVDAIEANRQDVIRKRERVMPQYKYITLEDKICVNQVLRFEQIERAFPQLCLRFGLGERSLPHANQSGPRTQEPSLRVRDFVAAYYQNDFQLFGY